MEIVKIGFCSSEKSEGCVNSPDKILTSLKKIKSSENGDLINLSKINVEEVFVDSSKLRESLKIIEENSEKYFYRNKKVFFLGGDQSISFPILKSFNRVEHNSLLILFDALGDFGEVGNVPDYSDWISHLIDSGFNSRNIILISGRNFSSKDLEFIKENQIVWIKMDILREDISGVCDIVMERARKSSGFYVSVDFNCFDSAFAPASLEPCIGGLTSGNLIYFIKRLNLLKNFRGGDFVNLVAKKDFNNLSFDLAGRILFECLV